MSRPRVSWRSQKGQTFTEFLMILGLLTAMIIALTQLILPMMQLLIGYLVPGIALYLTSPIP